MISRRRGLRTASRSSDAAAHGDILPEWVWTEEHGGQLRLFLDRRYCGGGGGGGGGEGEGYYDVEPDDRLLVFRSDQVEHEVLAAHRPRVAVTSWLYIPRVRAAAVVVRA